MAKELNGEEEKLLKLLREHELITQSQEKRVRLAVGRGMSLGEAVAKTPMVDPVKFASLQALASHEKEEDVRQPQEPERSQPLSDFTPIQAEENQEPVAFDLDEELPDQFDFGDEVYEFKDLGPVGEGEAPEAPEPPPEPAPQPAEPELDEIEDLDDLDLEFEEPEPAEQPEKNQAGIRPPNLEELRKRARAGNTGDGSAEVPAAPLPERELDLPDELELDAGAEDASDQSDGIELEFEGAEGVENPPAKGETPPPGNKATLRPATNIDEYQPRMGPVQTFSLEDDEGIPLIGEVNELLREAVDRHCSGIEFDVEPQESTVYFFDKNKKEEEARSIDGERAQKFVNRLKVMARMEPWRRRQAQKGKCRLQHGGTSLEMLVDQEPGPEGCELLTAHFRSAD